MRCILCLQDKPKNHFYKEHILPESGGNKPFVSSELICMDCNNSVSVLDQTFLYHPYVNFIKAWIGQRTKKRKLPKFDHSELFVSHDTENHVIVNGKECRFQVDANKNEIELLLPPRNLNLDQFRRFLHKAGLEFLALDHRDFALSERFDYIRKYVLGGVTEPDREVVFQCEPGIGRRIGYRIWETQGNICVSFNCLGTCGIVSLDEQTSGLTFFHASAEMKDLSFQISNSRVRLGTGRNGGLIS